MYCIVAIQPFGCNTTINFISFHLPGLSELTYETHQPISHSLQLSNFLTIAMYAELSNNHFFLPKQTCTSQPGRFENPYFGLNVQQKVQAACGMNRCPCTAYIIQSRCARFTDLILNELHFHYRPTIFEDFHT